MGRREQSLPLTAARDTTAGHPLQEPGPARASWPARVRRAGYCLLPSGAGCKTWLMTRSYDGPRGHFRRRCGGASVARCSSRELFSAAAAAAAAAAHCTVAAALETAAANSQTPPGSRRPLSAGVCAVPPAPAEPFCCRRRCHCHRAPLSMLARETAAANSQPPAGILKQLSAGERVPPAPGEPISCRRGRRRRHCHCRRAAAVTVTVAAPPPRAYAAPPSRHTRKYIYCRIPTSGRQHKSTM
eukprot:SAG22_NODE_2120_length_2981_cov_1.324080_4_plen_243_part_00